MSEEEKKAIKYLEFLSNEKCECKVCQNAKKHYRIILNLIEKQSKEIEIWEETENDYEHELVRKDEEIEKQQKEIDKLKSENQIFQRIKNGTTIIFKAKKKYIIEDKINKYYISKDKIREKIKKLENKNKYYVDEKGKHIKTPEDYKISVLKELLEEN